MSRHRPCFRNHSRPNHIHKDEAQVLLHLMALAQVLLHLMALELAVPPRTTCQHTIQCTDLRLHCRTYSRDSPAQHHTRTLPNSKFHLEPAPELLLSLDLEMLL
jgi:hypothetical protein